MGFDTSNPLEKDYFKGSGNFYNRPQREISLHWDGIEVANKMSEVEFRDSRFHDISVEILFKGGGAFVTVCMDEADIFRDRFISRDGALREPGGFRRPFRRGGRGASISRCPGSPVQRSQAARSGCRCGSGPWTAWWWDTKHPTRTAEVALPLPVAPGGEDHPGSHA